MTCELDEIRDERGGIEVAGDVRRSSSHRRVVVRKTDAKERFDARSFGKGDAIRSRRELQRPE